MIVRIKGAEHCFWAQIVHFVANLGSVGAKGGLDTFSFDPGNSQ